MDSSSDNVVRDHFLGWQCRLRQIAMRDQGGRPSQGMRPRAVLPGGKEAAAALTILLVPMEAGESTDYFRHQIKKTHDPKLIYEHGLSYLQAAYYQQPRQFSDEMTALFGAGAATAAILLEAGECILEFAQFSQTYKMICAVRALQREDAAFQATWWHNRIFNSALPDDVHILAFQPRWSSVQADPMP